MDFRARSAAIIVLAIGLAPLALARGDGVGENGAQVDPGADRARAAMPSLAEDARALARLGSVGLNRLGHWYRTTPPADRMVWGGLVGAGVLALGVFFERLLRIRPRRVIPLDFSTRFLDLIHEGRLDCGQALDHCERHPSPAARVALAAVNRWGRPSVDLERAVLLAKNVENDRLKRNVGTLRRVAALAPLIGLLGTLLAFSRALEAAPAALAARGTETLAAQLAEHAQWGRALAQALSPLTVGVVIAALALVAYDALMIRVERLAGTLERLGAETIDAIASSAPLVTPILRFGQVHDQPTQTVTRSDSPHDANPEPAHDSLRGRKPRLRKRRGIDLASKPRRNHTDT